MFDPMKPQHQSVGQNLIETQNLINQHEIQNSGNINSSSLSLNKMNLNKNAKLFVPRNVEKNSPIKLSSTPQNDQKPSDKVQLNEKIEDSGNNFNNIGKSKDKKP